MKSGEIVTRDGRLTLDFEDPEGQRAHPLWRDNGFESFIVGQLHQHARVSWIVFNDQKNFVTGPNGPAIVFDGFRQFG